MGNEIKTLKQGRNRLSAHGVRKERRKESATRRVDGYEYRMSKEQYEFLTSKDGGRLNSKEDVIKYLNQCGYKKPIVALVVS